MDCGEGRRGCRYAEENNSRCSSFGEEHVELFRCLFFFVLELLAFSGSYGA
jgi:hypothetical protein